LSWQYGTIIVHALEFTKWATWTKFQHFFISISQSFRGPLVDQVDPLVHQWIGLDHLDSSRALLTTFSSSIGQLYWSLIGYSFSSSFDLFFPKNGVNKNFSYSFSFEPQMSMNVKSFTCPLLQLTLINTDSEKKR
jgi:hypothetical protein